MLRFARSLGPLVSLVRGPLNGLGRWPAAPTGLLHAEYTAMQVGERTFLAATVCYYDPLSPCVCSRSEDRPLTAFLYSCSFLYVIFTYVRHRLADTEAYGQL